MSSPGAAVIREIPILESPTGSGFVKYIDHLGSDKRIVDAARISYLSESKGEDADAKLLHYLYRHGHSSPFEQCNITFGIKIPIFVMREFVRHRTFRLNEMSGRYIEFTKDYYTPSKWRKPDDKNKQGSGGEFAWEDDILNSQLAMSAVENSYLAYTSLLKRGVAREMARMILPVNMFTQIFVNCDLNNLLKFTRLRTSPNAQAEIQVVAGAMRSIAELHYPQTFEAYDRYKLSIEDLGPKDSRNLPAAS
jgi:thymidylate synthase (FAD)